MPGLSQRKTFTSASAGRASARFSKPLRLEPSTTNKVGTKPIPARRVVLHLFRMRFGMSELRSRALAAVDEVAEQARAAPVERHLALRFALAFLANFADERWPFDNFWRAVALRDEKVRSATVTAARNAIHRSVKE